MANQNIVVGNQQIIVLSPSRRIELISGVAGPPGPPGPSGTGAGGFNYVQVATPTGVEEGETWYKTDTSEAFVWYDMHWIQFAPGGEVGPPGPPGVQGPPGSAAATFTFVQGTPSNTWVITHNLPYPPNVTLIDTSDTQIEGSVMYSSATTITVTLSAATAGKAYLS